MRYRPFATSTLLVAIASAACFAPADPEPTDTTTSALGASKLVPVTGFGANPGALAMYEYVPSKLAAAPAVVVVLHGCTQGAADVARTGWNELADQHGFVVVYPEQSSANNPARCFNWGGVYGDFTNIKRGNDENASIKQMVDKSIALHGADAKRVFVAGFSAGGGQAALMAAAWPDVFAAGATIAGLPYHCNTTFAEAFTCMKPGVNRTPAQWATLVKQANAGYGGAWPRMAIWQGASDGTVAPANQTELVEQWTAVHGVGQTPSATDTVNGASHAVFKDAAGNAVVESYTVPGMDHGIAVDPKSGCGTAGSYALDKGICTAALVVKFFGIDSGGGSGSGTGGGSETGAGSGTGGGSVSGNGTANGSGAAPSPSTSTSTSTSTSPSGGSEGSAGSTCAFHPSRTGASGVASLVLAFALVAARRRARR